MILGFKKQFIQPILGGSKIHTIREDSHNRWKAGRKIHGATGVRTKQYNQFFEGECVSTQKIQIIHSIGHIEVFIGGLFFGEVFHHGLNDIYDYTTVLLDELVVNDGFADLKEFFQWFDKDFSGKIIHWSDCKY